ncbi:MAG TPA: hypothetical protein VF320_06540, partial [Acidimicrobiales bacterium]
MTVRSGIAWATATAAVLALGVGVPLTSVPASGAPASTPHQVVGPRGGPAFASDAPDPDIVYA